MQTSFLEYVLGVENIRSASKSELESAFDRLNRNVAKLNDQELRNARFSGAFIKLMTNLADEDFWSKTGVSTRARVRRMLDVEYVSEIYILTMHGVQDGKASLDDFYSSYDSEVPDQIGVTRRFRRVLQYLEGLPLDWGATRWANLADLYSLWAAMLELLPDSLPNPESASERLTAFGIGLEVKGAPEEDRRYLIAARQGSNKDANRLLRRDILIRVLTG
jgi:hypothetical protein